METKVLEMPHHNNDFGKFFEDYLNYLGSDDSESLEDPSHLSVTFPGSKQVYNLSLSELTHLGRVLCGTVNINRTEPIALLAWLYVLDINLKEHASRYSIIVDPELNLCILTTIDTEYVLEDFTSVYRAFLRYSVLGLDPNRKDLTEQNMPGYNDKFKLTRTNKGMSVEYLE